MCCADGSASFPLDHLFGTFRETLYAESKTYKGAGAEEKKEEEDSQAKSKAAKTSAIVGKSPRGFYVYMAFTLALFVLGFCAIWPVRPTTTCKQHFSRCWGVVTRTALWCRAWTAGCAWPTSRTCSRAPLRWGRSSSRRSSCASSATAPTCAGPSTR